MTAHMRRKSRGFTLIEVVVAIALATAMIVAVYSTTQAMSATARRQQAASREDARLDRFLEILQRDLQGIVWNEGVKQETNQSRSSNTYPVFLSFETTADERAAREAFTPARRTAVRYTVETVQERFQIVRMENDGLGASTALPLLSLDARPQVEWWSGGKWSREYGGKPRPSAIRLSLDSHWIAVGL